jgi:hypothetical protein
MDQKALDSVLGAKGFQSAAALIAMETVNVADLDGNGRAEVLVSAALNWAGGQLGIGGGGPHSSGGSVDGNFFMCGMRISRRDLGPMGIAFG